MLAWDGLAIGNQQWPIYALAAVTVLYVVFRPILRRKKDPLEKLPTLSLTQQRTVEREMSNLLVEMSEMARQITAQLDTRAAKLQVLLDQADQKIAQLEEPGAHPAAQPASSSEADPRYREIYELAEQGRTPAEIAQQLARPRGEIELILALRPGKQDRSLIDSTR